MADTKRVTCPECKNELEVAEGVKVLDVIECQYCGVELEVTSVDDGQIKYSVIEEEK